MELAVQSNVIWVECFCWFEFEFSCINCSEKITSTTLRNTNYKLVCAKCWMECKRTELENEQLGRGETTVETSEMNAALVSSQEENVSQKFLLALHRLSAFLMNALTFSFQFLVHPNGIGDTTENTIINWEDILKAIFNCEDISKAISQNDQKVTSSRLVSSGSSGRIDQSLVWWKHWLFGRRWAGLEYPHDIDDNEDVMMLKGISWWWWCWCQGLWACDGTTSRERNTQLRQQYYTIVLVAIITIIID